MQGFVGKIVSMMKSQGLFEPQGGPIILSQVQNTVLVVTRFLSFSSMSWKLEYVDSE